MNQSEIDNLRARVVQAEDHARAEVARARDEVALARRAQPGQPQPWTRAELQQAWREGRAEDIVQAKRDGLLNDLTAAPANTRSVRLGDEF